MPVVLLRGHTDIVADLQNLRVAFPYILVLSSRTKSGHSLFLGCQCPVDASAVFSCRTPEDLCRAGLPSRLFHGFLDRVGRVLDGLLGLPDYLVGLSFVPKLVVAGQCA
jgi:hypothetical protein